MKYKELKGFFYKSTEEYSKEYLSRFESEDAIKINFYIDDNQAFFLQNHEVMNLALQIERLDKKIQALCHDLPGIALGQYSRKCLIDEIVLTNKIEGVNSSRKEIGEALLLLESQSEKRKGSHSRFTSLVNKYFTLLKAENITMQSCEDIRKLYDTILLDEVLIEDSANRPDGTVFRKDAVSVLGDTGREIHSGVTPEAKIIQCMEQALHFLNDETIEPLFRICLFHYLVEYIHPFYDGNGRLGRFILSYGISQSLSPILAFRISETIKENIQSYYKAFGICNDHRNLADLTPFLIMQLGMIHSSMEVLILSLEERKTTWDKYEKIIAAYHKGDSELAKLYSVLIQAALFSEMGISTRELEQHMQCSSYLRNQLMQKIPPELIVKNKKGNQNYYLLNLTQLNEQRLQNIRD